MIESSSHAICLGVISSNIHASNSSPLVAQRAERFFATLARFDDKMAARLKRARSHGAVLRYVGSLARGRARARIQEFRCDHPMAMTKGSDNIIAFNTKRYSQTPLVIQGPGAGPDVTAMGVFSDILKLLHYLPH